MHYLAELTKLTILHRSTCIKLETLNPFSKASNKRHVLVSMSKSRRSLVRITALTIFPFIKSKCREFFVEKSIDLCIMSFHLQIQKGLFNWAENVNCMNISLLTG